MSEARCRADEPRPSKLSVSTFAIEAHDSPDIIRRRRCSEPIERRDASRRPVQADLERVVAAARLCCEMRVCKG